MTPAQLIQSVIDGDAVPDDLRAFALGIADGSVSDAQAGAFAMAVKLRGLRSSGFVAWCARAGAD